MSRSWPPMMWPLAARTGAAGGAPMKAVRSVAAMSDVLQVYTAAGSREAAQRLAQGAVQARLAAGGQVIGPVESVFWHEGRFGTGQEWQVVLKSSSGRYPELEVFLKEHHEWANPEITAVPVVAGSASYLTWVRSITEKTDDSQDT